MLGTKLTRKHELKHTRISPEEVSLRSSSSIVDSRRWNPKGWNLGLTDCFKYRWHSQIPTGEPWFGPTFFRIRAKDQLFHLWLADSLFLSSPSSPSLSKEAAKREPFQHLGNCLPLRTLTFSPLGRGREASLAQQFEYSFEKASVY